MHDLTPYGRMIIAAAVNRNRRLRECGFCICEEGHGWRVDGERRMVCNGCGLPLDFQGKPIIVPTGDR